LQVQVLSPVLGPPCNSRAWTCRSPREPKLENSTAEWHEKPAAGATTGPPRGQRPGHHPWSIFHAPAGLCPGRCAWGLSSAGRASAWHAEGRRFETVRLHKKGGVPVPSASRRSGTGRDGQGRRTSASPRASGRVQLCGWLPHLPGWPPETLESATRGWSRGRARLRTSSRSTSTPRVNLDVAGSIPVVRSSAEARGGRAPPAGPRVAQHGRPGYPGSRLSEGGQ
jgi:hypothetical protein